MQPILTDREADVMQVLWDHGGSTVADVRDRLGISFAYTTVLSVLRTLECKGYVSHEVEGRTYRYRPTVEREVAREAAVRALSKKLFQGSAELLIKHIIVADLLTATEVERTHKLFTLRKKRKLDR